MGLKLVGDYGGDRGVEHRFIYSIQGTPLELEIYSKGSPQQRFGIGYPTQVNNPQETLEVFRWVAALEKPRRRKPISLLDRVKYEYVNHPLDVDSDQIPPDVRDLYFYLYRKHLLWASGHDKVLKFEQPPSFNIVSKQKRLPPYLLEFIKRTSAEDMSQIDLTSAFAQFEKELVEEGLVTSMCQS